jgi:3-methyladenine DNA glycosylase AlkC
VSDRPDRRSLPAQGSIPAEILNRRGARTTRDVPAEVRRLLDAGQIETTNLCEWLVVDQLRLAEAVAAEFGWPELPSQVEQRLSTIEKRTAVKDLAAIGGVLAGSFRGKRAGDEAGRRLIRHPSDVVRSWGAYLIGGQERLSLAEKLRRVRPLAADRHMGVRESAWLAVREAIAAELNAAIEVLAGWAEDEDANVRRFASEATRPRGVWCRHIDRLKEEPELGLPILEPLRSDGAKYVQDSVGNWLNDASKSQPGWVRQVCRRWTRESRTPATERIVSRGLRTLQK